MERERVMVLNIWDWIGVRVMGLSTWVVGNVSADETDDGEGVEVAEREEA